MSHTLEESSGPCESPLDILERGGYLKPSRNASLFQTDVISKIEEFSKWFNSEAKLYMLRCGPNHNEPLIYLLLNLKKNIGYALSSMNSTLYKKPNVYTCQICGCRVIWDSLETHEHFECIPKKYIQNAHIEEFAAVQPKVEEGLNSFRFNFAIDMQGADSAQELLLSKIEAPIPSKNKPSQPNSYCERIEQTLYPMSYLTAARKFDKLPDYTIQRCGPKRGYCLLCPCSMSSKSTYFKLNAFAVQNHAIGHRHIKNASNESIVLSLRNYHHFWMAQHPNYQSHQVYFIPEYSKNFTLKCVLCNRLLNYTNTLSHINDDMHRNRIITFVESKQVEYYLLDMQVAVYNIKVQCNGNEKSITPLEVTTTSKKEKASKNDSNATNNSTPSRKCVFTKNVISKETFFLPQRYMDHCQFLSFSKENNKVFCQVCKTYFTDISSKKHVLSKKHIELTHIPVTKAYTLYCDICNSVFNDELSWDEHFNTGQNRHGQVSPAEIPKLGEYECKTCAVVIFGDKQSRSRHIATRPGNSSSKKAEINLPQTVKKLFRSKVYIEEEGSRLREEARCKQIQEREMRECCEDLKETVISAYPKCSVYPFGSRISGLGNNQSDLDVYMDLGDMYTGVKDQDPVTQKEFVVKVTKFLKHRKDVFANVVGIPVARTPITKLQHCFTKIDCDLSFRHGLGVENTKFIRFCIDLQPITQPFILLLKKWSSYCNLNEHITNYALAIMGIFYLQTSGFLMPVQKIRQFNKQIPLVIDGWETIRYTTPVEIMKPHIKHYPCSLKELLRDFLYYFSTFDYNNHVVCPLLGYTVPKMLFSEPLSLEFPPEMRCYILKISSDGGERFRYNTPFCVQDPFDLSHNLTKACQHGVIIKLKTLCKLSYELLDSIE